MVSDRELSLYGDSQVKVTRLTECHFVLYRTVKLLWGTPEIACFMSIILISR